MAWRAGRTDLLFDMKDHKVVLPTDPAVAASISKFRLCGGVLADEMGLGKTMEGGCACVCV